jgi:hypothetical protein
MRMVIALQKDLILRFQRPMTLRAVDRCTARSPRTLRLAIVTSQTHRSHCSTHHSISHYARNKPGSQHRALPADVEGGGVLSRTIE